MRNRLSIWTLLALLLNPGAIQAATEPFSDWLQGVRKEALERGISETTLDSALSGLQPLPKVIELDRRQPESTMTFQKYLQRVVPKRRENRARNHLAEQGELLKQIGRKFGVQPRFIVALWGIESDFGRLTGGYSVIASLATLAYDGRRGKFFRGELLNALQILDEGHVAAEMMTGSWAGAMGQVQFMPSSFNRYAIDYDGDGRRDIWNSQADAFASAANYLARSGWLDDQTWGRLVLLPEGFDRALVGRKIVKRLSEWQALGVRRQDGSDLPTRDLAASIVQPGGADGPAYAVYNNYKTLLKWNRSDYFATAVGTLADRIGAPNP